VASVADMAPIEIDADRVERWREWALDQADRLDPIKTGRIWDDIRDS
jgi:hypothetical protein